MALEGPVLELPLFSEHKHSHDTRPVVGLERGRLVPNLERHRTGSKRGSSGNRKQAEAVSVGGGGAPDEPG